MTKLCVVRRSSIETALETQMNRVIKVSSVTALYLQAFMPAALNNGPVKERP